MKSCYYYLPAPNIYGSIAIVIISFYVITIFSVKDVRSITNRFIMPNRLNHLNSAKTFGVGGAKRMSATHVEDGDDRRILPTNDVGDVLCLGHLGGDQLERKQLETWSPTDFSTLVSRITSGFT